MRTRSVPLLQGLTVFLLLFQHASQVTELPFCPVMLHCECLMLLTQLAELSCSRLKVGAGLCELMSRVCESLLCLCQLLGDTVTCSCCLENLQCIIKITIITIIYRCSSWLLSIY